MSTPACSSFIRKVNEKDADKCVGGILLTASHNPGGENEDFGVKFNTKNGGPALETLTNQMFEESKKITVVKKAKVPAIDINKAGDHQFGKVQGFDFNFSVKVVDSCDNYVEQMKSLFDFDLIKKLVSRPDFKLVIDGMHGAAGPYAYRIFHDILGLPESNLMRCNILPDFGGHHPDPNLTYAEDLVKTMGIFEHKADAPDFGAACDGDADRNMILGKNFFVTPSDSLAIIAANYKSIPFLKGGISGAARSMPTSGALDFVMKKLGLDCYETPTGWKFFGNLLDAGKISLCGEESFGTGSFHIREKDGLWAILCWLAILADKNASSEKLISVEEIVKQHWAEYGRNYYQRYDYENLSTEDADKVFDQVKASMAGFQGETEGNTAIIFDYTDPVDGSVSKNQGFIFKWADGSRFIFRKSGTGSSGATIRIYLERYSKEIDQDVKEALKVISEKALAVSKIHELSGRDKPTVIT